MDNELGMTLLVSGHGLIRIMRRDQKTIQDLYKIRLWLGELKITVPETPGCSSTCLPYRPGTFRPRRRAGTCLGSG